MGGRGGASHRTTAGASFQSVMQMASSLGLSLNMLSLNRANINPIYIEETLKGIQGIYDAFPALRGAVKYLDAEETRSSALASAGGDGGLHMGLYGRYSPEQLKESWDRCLQTGFHPKGTTSAGIFVHEMGHQIEVYLNKRDFNSAWSWGATADQVVFEGIRNIDPTITTLHSKEAYKVASKISKYAVSNYNSVGHSWSTWETLAEAVADYYENGEKAVPLSKEIWKILQRKMK